MGLRKINAEGWPHQKALSTFVRARRLELGMTQVVLASRASWSRSCLSRLETQARGAPKLETLERLADALDVSLMDLVGRCPTCPEPCEAQ